MSAREGKRPSRKRVDKWIDRIFRVGGHVLAVTQRMPERVVLREIVPRGMCFAFPLDSRLGLDGAPYELAIHPETWAAIKDAYPASDKETRMIWGMPVQEDVAA